MTQLLRIAATVLALSLHPCGAAENPILGAWRLTSFVRVQSDGAKYDQLGPHPDGYLIYSPDGRMSALFVDGDRAPPKQAPPTDAERAALYAWIVKGDVPNAEFGSLALLRAHSAAKVSEDADAATCAELVRSSRAPHGSDSLKR